MRLRCQPQDHAACFTSSGFPVFMPGSWWMGFIRYMQSGSFTFLISKYGRTRYIGGGSKTLGAAISDFFS